jgi:toxin ParE1/3/4
MEEFEEKPVIYSRQYAIDTEYIYNYGVETFGEVQAKKYEAFLDKLTNELPQCYLMYPECRHLATKTRMYRNIILESHLIIYRIAPTRIEVLKAISSRLSISKIKSVRKIKF